MHPVLGGIQRGLPSRKHMAKVNEKPGMVSSAPAKCPWCKVPQHAGGVSMYSLTLCQSQSPVCVCLEDALWLDSCLVEEWCDGCMSPALLTRSMGTIVAGWDLCSPEMSLAFLQGKCMPWPFLNCGYKNCLGAAVSGEMPHVRASPGNMASLQHTRICKPGPWQQAQDTAGSFLGDGGLPSCPHTVTRTSLWTLECCTGQAKKQEDHQELPNSSLTNATCPTPAHPEKNVSKDTEFVILGQCKKGRTHHCLYTWNFHILHFELKTTFPGPNFCCFFCKQNSHASFVSRIQHCLDRKGYHHFSWGLSNFSWSQKFPAFQTSY